MTGQITLSNNPAWNCLPGAPSGAGSYGPVGNQELNVQVYYHNTDGSGDGTVFLNGAAGSSSAESGMLYADKQIEIKAGRQGWSATCGFNPAIAGFFMSGSQILYVEQLTDFIHVTANPDAVPPGTNVTFTTTRDDGKAINIDHWYWQPDAGAAGTAGNRCSNWDNPSCVYAPVGSGTMTVYTWDGPASAHVRVAGLLLKAAPTAGPKNMQTTFIASWDNGDPVPLM